MKKSLIALAVLASSGAVMAQSSVTLYGVVDAFVGGVTTETGPGTKVTQTVVGSGGGNTSRWGLRGTEDLGGGLKANFVLENGFSTDTGASSAGIAGMFGRQAFVGLSGDFGAVTLGNQYTAYFALHNATNNLADTNLNTTSGPVTTLANGSAFGGVWSNGVVRHTDRATNSIAYASPVFSGVSGAVAIGLGEDKSAAAATTPTPQPALGATKNYSLHLKYANGPLLVGYAYQVENARTPAGSTIVTTPATPATATTTLTAASNTLDRKYNLLAASYDFGVAKLTGGFNMAKQGTVKDKEYQVGVSAPFGAAAVHAGYSYSKSDDGIAATLVDAKAQGLSLLGTYSLSKRTTLYAGVSSTKFKDTTGANSAKTSIVAAGVRHTF